MYIFGCFIIFIELFYPIFTKEFLWVKIEMPFLQTPEQIIQQIIQPYTKHPYQPRTTRTTRTKELIEILSQNKLNNITPISPITPIMIPLRRLCCEKSQDIARCGRDFDADNKNPSGKPVYILLKYLGNTKRRCFVLLKSDLPGYYRQINIRNVPKCSQNVLS